LCLKTNKSSFMPTLMRTPMLMPAQSSSPLITVPARTLLTQASLRERVETLLRQDERLIRSFVPGMEPTGFRVQGIDQAAAIRFTVLPLTDKINRVELTFHKKDQKLAGLLLDLLMPDVVDEITLAIFRMAGGSEPTPGGPVIAWPEELLAA
jgi:hypothetical protein